jgi:dihydroxyacetone kinase-like protein
MPERSVLDSADIESWLRLLAQAFEQNMERLSQFDAALGDGDHGSSLVRSFRAIVAKLDGPARPPDSAGMLQMAGMTLLSVSGGATGPLFGTIFLEAAKAAKGKDDLSLSDIAAMFAAATAGVMQRGGARPGQKTMVDALVPAAQVLQQAVEEGLSPAAGLRRAEQAARAGAHATADMLAAQGRARYLGERSLGHEDAGAHSVAIIVAALAQVAARV